MTEPSEWLVVQGDVWHIPQRRDSAVPIRRGTAQRLGLRRPKPALWLVIKPDTSGFDAACSRLRTSLQELFAGPDIKFQPYWQRRTP